MTGKEEPRWSPVAPFKYTLVAIVHAKISKQITFFCTIFLEKVSLKIFHFSFWMICFSFSSLLFILRKKCLSLSYLLFRDSWHDNTTSLICLERDIWVQFHKCLNRKYSFFACFWQKKMRFSFLGFLSLVTF